MEFFPGPLLVVAAHPDDEVLGCGGSALRLADRGVHVLILGEGATSRALSRDRAETLHISELQKAAMLVRNLLGVSSLSFAGLPDNRFDSLDLLDVVKLVEEHIARLRPATVLTHHLGDLNVDHMITARAVLTATRPMQGGCVRQVAFFEVASSTEWSFSRLTPPFEPNLFVDISDTLGKKIRAMEVYETEMRSFPHPRSAKAIEALAATRGTAAGMQAAEAFQLVRALC